ncbi:uncharacterized protein LOC125190744 isoform X3 [Salvia hispanica]|uniref:uncharacterized protein LOC125190744 isoform X3 n=1 Tax=Salvia hispanica TaxID=49212 RepID=UPI0020096333|nr:uncharacterized protein LOC125190744 isoform X3 [Salvia hispanica]
MAIILSCQIQRIMVLGMTRHLDQNKIRMTLMSREYMRTSCGRLHREWGLHCHSTQLSGPGQGTGTVELAGIIFTGEPAKNKKQAEKYAALAAWLY